MNKGSGSSTTVIRNLPSWADNSAATYLERAKKLYNENKDTEYTGSIYAKQAQDEIDAINALAERGRGGDPLVAVGIDYTKNVLYGSFLEGNDADFRKAVSNVIDSAKSTYDNNIKSYIDGDSPYLMGDDKEHLVLDLVNTQIFYDSEETKLSFLNYHNERSRQDRVLSHAIELGYQSVADAELLRTAGLYAREYEQGSLDAEYRKWFDARINEVRNLEILGNAVRSLVGAERTVSTPNYKPSPLGTIMGAALTIGGAVGGFMLGGPPGLMIGSTAGQGVGSVANSF